ncbi:hypothetical protein BDU57DRAFT_531261 [Ampelomyces quisqualis]|uniref:Uncharacterized protein n=1 Tax=Ampelomyces quisqualis TaxID=50730 RepID=A0A6A5QGJ0_AMPQU|nr:hypothetical protein BDU57DRAFT_531261 [Ampelomyces quisqualis]
MAPISTIISSIAIHMRCGIWICSIVEAVVVVVVVLERLEVHLTLFNVKVDLGVTTDWHTLCPPLCLPRSLSVLLDGLDRRDAAPLNADATSELGENGATPERESPYLGHTQQAATICLRGTALLLV